MLFYKMLLYKCLKAIILRYIEIRYVIYIIMYSNIGARYEQMSDGYYFNIIDSSKKFHNYSCDCLYNVISKLFI